MHHNADAMTHSPTTTTFDPSNEAMQALLAAIVSTIGEPLVNPTRIEYAISRPTIEASANRRIRFDYKVDDLNPFGVLIIAVEG